MPGHSSPTTRSSSASVTSRRGPRRLDAIPPARPASFVRLARTHSLAPHVRRDPPRILFCEYGCSAPHLHLHIQLEPVPPLRVPCLAMIVRNPNTSPTWIGSSDGSVGFGAR